MNCTPAPPARPTFGRTTRASLAGSTLGRAGPGSRSAGAGGSGRSQTFAGRAGRAGRRAARAAIDRNEETDDLAYELLEFLSTSRGGPIEREVFVTSPEYGTRSSTVILCDVFGDYLFVEQNFGPNGERQGDKVKLTLT